MMQHLSVTIHNPKVERIARLDDEEKIVVTLGNGIYNGHVSVIVSPADWLAVAADVAAWLENEGAEAENLRRKNAGERQCGCGGYGDHDETHEV